MISARSLALRRGQKLLFDEASFTLHRGERIGITGQNGAGKSSFFELILGRLQPEQGSFDMSSGLEIAHVAQETPGSDRSALDYVLDGDRELRELEATISEVEATGDGLRLAELYGHLEEIGGYEAPARASKLLHGLGFAPGSELNAVSEFSGGWRVRLNVAKALMCRSDVLLLDEPTNHLDLDAVIWLQDWLQGYPGTLLLVSHDRDFLDDLVTHVLNIERGKVSLHTGNYSDFERRRAEILSQQQSSFDRQQRELKRVQGFIDRFRAQATKARQVQSRIKALGRMELIAQAQADSNLEFGFYPPLKAPTPLLKLDEVTVGYGDRVIIEKALITINPGDRIGLLGPNGAGKSTFIKLLAGVLEGRSGERIDAQDLKMGYFAQHQLEQLIPDESPLQHLKRLDPRAYERDLRNYLGGFGFRGEQALEPVGPFSGGEKSRLALALLIYQRPNLILLDEPTNHLDLATRDQLALALQDYEGALVLVSHDRYLLRTVADDFWLVSDGKAQPFEGDLEAYRTWLNTRKTSEASARKTSAQPQKSESSPQPAKSKKSLKSLESAVQKAESSMTKLLRSQQELETLLGDMALYDPSKEADLKSLLAQKQKTDAELQDAESIWLEASEALDRAVQIEDLA